MAQAAYDRTHPNGSDLHGTRVLHIYRLYRKANAPGLGDFTGSGALDTARAAIRSVRNRLRSLVGEYQGRILEREVKVALLIDRIDETPEVRSSLSYVSDGVPGKNVYIDMPFRSAKGVTHFRITGRTFWTPVTVDGLSQDGDAALLDLQQLIDDYLYPRDGGMPADFELYWINLDAPRSAEDPFGASEWLIHPVRHGLRVNHAVDRQAVRLWQLEFAGIRSNRDLAKERGILRSLLGTSGLAALLDAFDLGAITEFLNDAFGLIDEILGLVDDVTNIVTAVTDLITGVQQFIKAAFAKVRAAFDKINTLIARVEDAIQLLKDFPNLIDEQLRLLRQSVPGLASQDPDEAVAIATLGADSLRRVRDLLLALQAQPELFIPTLASTPAEPQTIALNIPPGVTIEQLSRTTNATSAALIEVNDLQYPFVDARERPEKKLARLEAEHADLTARDAARVAAGLAPQYTAQLAALTDRIAEATVEATTDPALPNVLYAGDVVRVPQERPEHVPSIIGIDGSRLNLVLAGTGQAVNEEERLFGIDLLLNDDGDLEWDLDRLDLRLSRGLDNMQRAQVRYMRLPWGALRFAPQIGNFAWQDLSEWQSPAENRMLAYAIWRTLAQDPRVRRVRNVRAESQGGLASIRYDAELINGRHLPDLRAPLEGLA